MDTFCYTHSAPPTEELVDILQSRQWLYQMETYPGADGNTISVIHIQTPLDETEITSFQIAINSHRNFADRIVRCPSCQGMWVVYPDHPQSSMGAAVIERVAEMAGIKERSYLCQNCQYTWT